MFGKSLFVTALMASVGLSACAQSKQDSVDRSGQNNRSEQAPNGQKTTDCATRFAISQYCLTWKWETPPVGPKPGSLVFKVWKSNSYDGSPILMDLSPTPEFYFGMPSHGHGSPSPVTKLDVGTFRVPNLKFSMPGEWELRFQVKDGKSILDEAVVAITL